jgi:hypothetical protein
MKNLKCWIICRCLKILGIKLNKSAIELGASAWPKFQSSFCLYFKKNPQKIEWTKSCNFKSNNPKVSEQQKSPQIKHQKHLCFCHRPVTARFLFTKFHVFVLSPNYLKIKNFEAFEEGKSRHVRKICWQCKAPRAVTNLLMPQNRKHERDFCFPISDFIFNSELCKKFDCWIIKITEL